jgi:hypothetical protein
LQFRNALRQRPALNGTLSIFQRQLLFPESGTRIQTRLVQILANEQECFSEKPTENCQAAIHLTAVGAIRKGELNHSLGNLTGPELAEKSLVVKTFYTLGLLNCLPLQHPLALYHQ